MGRERGGLCHGEHAGLQIWAHHDHDPARTHADSGEHNATPEKVIAAREHAQMVMLHGMAKSLAAQHGNNR